MVLLISLLSLAAGYLAHKWITILTSLRNPFINRFFKIYVIQLCCLLTWLSIYFNHGINGFFFLYAGFSLFLIIILWTDMLECSINDSVIKIGIIYCLCLQFYLGQGLFAIFSGLLVGISIGILYFVLNNIVFRPGDQLDQEETESEMPGSLPFAPALILAVCIHALLPNGLTLPLLTMIQYIQESTYIKFGIVIICIVILIVVLVNIMHQRQNKEIAGKMPAIGDGDITMSIFLSVNLGALDFVAVFWLSMVLHSIIGSGIRFFYSPQTE